MKRSHVDLIMSVRNQVCRNINYPLSCIACTAAAVCNYHISRSLHSIQQPSVLNVSKLSHQSARHIVCVWILKEFLTRLHADLRYYRPSRSHDSRSFKHSRVDL